VAATHDGSYIRVYVNGALDSNGAENPKSYGAGSIANTGASFRLGQTDESYAFDGLMDVAGILNRTLSAAEVNDIYLNGIQDPSAGKIPVFMSRYHHRRG
jgi:hypothetical protein